VIVEKKVYVPQGGEFAVNEEELRKLNLTTREHEVLQLLSRGHSNAEIAERLFLSLSTVKTHVSNLLVKMDVKSRVQALEKAKRLRITP
jgi:DNA-binding NarL/FixJ family response regulator